MGFFFRRKNLAVEIEPKLRRMLSQESNREQWRKRGLRRTNREIRWGREMGALCSWKMALLALTNVLCHKHETEWSEQDAISIGKFSTMIKRKTCMQAKTPAWYYISHSFQSWTAQTFDCFGTTSIFVVASFNRSSRDCSTSLFAYEESSQKWRYTKDSKSRKCHRKQLVPSKLCACKEEGSRNAAPYLPISPAMWRIF